MKIKLLFVSALILGIVVSACKKDEEPNEQVTPPVKYKTIKVETSFGNFRIWLYNETPQHRDNFLELAGQEFYDSLIYHRVVDNFVVQGGDPEGTGYGGPGYTVPAEFVSSLHHVYGAVGMARMSDNINPDKESNGSQYYIVVDTAGTSFLDMNYTVFGFVFHGMDAVFNISKVDVDTNDRPLETVYMNKMTIEEYTAAELKNLFGYTAPVK
ncbi:MAG: peptidylprolyl isomerase [Bacteroidales bacterium]|nr:peptidylprolyl isomerase [Bacteroidales bacterium]